MSSSSANAILARNQRCGHTFAGHRRGNGRRGGEQRVARLELDRPEAVEFHNRDFGIIKGCPRDLSRNMKADRGARMGFDGQRGMVAPFGSPSRPGLDGFGGGFSPFGSSRNCLLYNAPGTRGGGVRKRTEARLAKEREPRCGHTLIGDREVRPIGHKQPPGGGGGVTCAGPREGRIRDHEVPRP